jgi:murein L,D-transpeptidase YcbB/YkuD
MSVTSCKLFTGDDNLIVPDLSSDSLYSSMTLIVSDTFYIQSLKGIEKGIVDSLLKIYQQNNFNPFWLSEETDTLQIQIFLIYLENSFKHGFDPERYYFKSLNSAYQSLLANRSINKSYNYQELAKFEFLLSVAYLQYQKNLLYGIINPHEYDTENYDIPKPDRGIDIYDNLYKSNKDKILEEIQPKSKRYVGLQNALEFYKEFAIGAVWSRIPMITGKIEVGKHATILKPLSQNLISLGLLDSSYHLSFPPHYDSLLFKAVKQFQLLYGLKDDGVIGSQTIEQLNITPLERVEQIKVNMERFRWTTYIDSLTYVLVNIPDFTLFAYKEGELQTSIKVCVGQKRERNYDQKIAVYKKTKKWIHLPKNFETPQVYSRINQIITNPPWNVPTSIAKNETYYEVMKDSNYLNDKKFKVFQGGKEIDHNEIDWKKYSPTNLPFSFVQEPGGANALGRIKFMFNNKYSIYLHDTPTRAPFSTANRAVSHGCVRVEKPLMFAEYLTGQVTNVTLDDVKIELGIKPEDKEMMKYFKGYHNKTKYLELNSTIPLFVDYFTAWVDDKNQLQFRPDVYEKDKKLAQALSEAENTNHSEMALLPTK